jgi:hypothetical protein
MEIGVKQLFFVSTITVYVPMKNNLLVVYSLTSHFLIIVRSIRDCVYVVIVMFPFFEKKTK